MTARADVVVLGGGIEGLVAATRLARAGRRVVLCDEADELGGAARRGVLGDGFRAPGPLEDASCVRRELLADLELERHGLAWTAAIPPLLCSDDDRTVRIDRDPTRLVGADGDRAAYADWRRFLERIADLVNGVLDQAPPEAESPGPAELWRLAKTALELRRLGERDMLELLRVAPMAARDWTTERFEDPLFVTGLVAPALFGSVLAPRAAGTSALLLLRECAARPEPRGGAAGLVDALVAACAAAGVQLRLGQPLRAIDVDRRGVQAVVLGDAGDERIETGLVLSTLNPRRTLGDLIAPVRVPDSLARAAAGWRSAGATAVLQLGLDEVPAFGGLEAGEIERVCTARSLVELERAADGLKYGELPEAPWLWVRLASATDPALAPGGAAVLTAAMHGVPRDLRGGWTDEARERLEQRAVGALERVLPGVRDRIAARRLLTPADIEGQFGLYGGHLFDGELALDQLWIQRPSLAFSRYRTPIPGLWLGGAGAHPGGPFLGGAGTLAAQALRG